MPGEITGGAVTYGQTVNTGDYNSKKAEATFSYAGDYADEAGKRAVAKVQELLSLKGSTPVTVKVETKAAAPVATVVLKDAAAVEAPKASDPAAITEDEDFTKVSAAVISDQALQDAMAKKKQALGHFLSPPEPTKKIKALAAKFVKPGSTQLSDMPQDVRQQFLNELEALKP